MVAIKCMTHTYTHTHKGWQMRKEYTGRIYEYEAFH